MDVLFYIAAGVATAATAMVVTRTNAIHALLYMIVSLLAAGVVFFSLGAPFAAAMEAIVYAGAIMVLFVFVIMMFNLPGEAERQQERGWLGRWSWVGPASMASILAGEMLWAILKAPAAQMASAIVTPVEVGRTLYSQYLLAVELASTLLLAGLVGAYHLARPLKPAAKHGGS